jgi:hypothetical protein
MLALEEEMSDDARETVCALLDEGPNRMRCRARSRLATRIDDLQQLRADLRPAGSSSDLSVRAGARSQALSARWTLNSTERAIRTEWIEG